MKNISKLLVLFMAIILMVTGMGQSTHAQEVDNNQYVTRLGGVDRVDTAVLTSKSVYKKANVVVLAGSNGDIDALTGTLLAASKNAPLLLTTKNKLSENTKNEIQRLEAKIVYILGGDNVVSEVVVNSLKALDKEVIRVGGSNRYETAANIASTVKDTSADHAFIVMGKELIKGDSLADGLAVGPAAATKNSPVLLVESNRLPNETIKAIKDLGVKDITIIGGNIAVSAKVEAQLKALVSGNVNRVYGSSRENTALKIAETYFPYAGRAVLANGRRSADALVGGYLAHNKKVPILLSSDKGLTAETKTYLDKNVSFIHVLGGEAAVSKGIFATVKKSLDNKEEITILKDQKLKTGYKSVKVSGNDLVLDLDGNTVTTMTISGNNTTIKNGTVLQLTIEKEVNDVLLEDLVDDHIGQHYFKGGGANSIRIKGYTTFEGTVYITSTTPIRLTQADLDEVPGFTGKIVIETDAAVTIAAQVDTVEITQENKNITIEAKVNKVVALADTEIKVGKNIEAPKLEKAKGVEAKAEDSTGKQLEIKENEQLLPVTPKDPVVPTPGGGSPTVVPVSAINITGNPVVGATLTAAVNSNATGTITYQWQRSVENIGAGQVGGGSDSGYENIDDKIDSTFVITKNELEKTIRVVASGANGSTKTSDPTAVVSKDIEAPKLGDVTFTTDEEGNLVLTVKATDNAGLATLEVDHSLEKFLPEFTVGIEAASDEGHGASSTFADGTWTLNFGPKASETIRVKTESMTFHFVITDVNGNKFGSMSPTTPGNTKTFVVPAYPTIVVVRTPENLTAALAKEGVTEITIDGILGSDNRTDGYTIYNVNRPVTIQGVKDAQVFGSFIVKADDVTIKDLAIQNKGDLELEEGKTESSNHRGGIYVYANNVTLTNNTITNGLGDKAGLSNAIQIMSPTTDNPLSNYIITKNKLIGHYQGVPQWDSSGIIIAAGYNPGAIGAEAKSITAKLDDYENLLNVNTFKNNKIDLTHEDYKKSPSKLYPYAIKGLTISGDVKVGETLTANILPTEATATYQWQVLQGEVWTPITNATGKTYELTADDVGKHINVRADGTGNYAGWWWTSARTIEVANSTNGE